MGYPIPIFSPTKLNLFQRCPYAYWRRYIDRSMPELPPTRELIRGAVTHQILNLALRDFRRGVDLPVDVTDQATDLLSKYPELSATDVECETEQVAELAGFALDHFNTECEVVMAEDELSYLHQEQFRLMARTDAILRHPDGVFEVIDWKTGNSDYIDRIQSLLLYIGALTFLKREFNAGPEHVRLTFAFLGHRRYRTMPVDRESSKAVWKEIKQLIRSIQRSRTWPARLNPLCDYCPLHRKGCPLAGPDYLNMEPDPV
jgi:putative RecB family exonuclease